MKRLATVAGLALCLAACGGSSGGGPTTPTVASTPTTTTTTTPPATATPTPPPTVPEPPADTPPVLSVTIVDLSGSYDPRTRRLGALNCNFVFANDQNDRFCFNAFAVRFPNRPSASPSYDYKVAAGSTVFAATAGTVTRVEAETNPLYPDEFEIETRATTTTAYVVIYDHVKNLRVGRGDTVTPGTVLGTAGIQTSDRNTFGRVELQINRILDRTNMRSESLCPRTFGTAAFNQLNDAARAAHNDANPAFAHASVCLADTVQP